MDKLLQTIIFGNYRVRDLLWALAAAAAVLLLAGFIRRLLAGRPKSTYAEAVVCTGCGWKGRVSKYAGRCPRCNQPLGQQKARRK
jgi:hypothetical protein